eukprot:5409070-Heterocapsa_arctica.AAC.1
MCIRDSFRIRKLPSVDARSNVLDAPSAIMGSGRLPAVRLLKPGSAALDARASSQAFTASRPRGCL